MNKPKMILFDYGQTLLNEIGFNGITGYSAILLESYENPYNITAQDLLNFEIEFNKKSNRYCLDKIDKYLFEIHNYQYWHLVIDYFKLKFKISLDEIDDIFWEKSFEKVTPTKNIEKLLEFLYEKNIRTAVLSNISYSQRCLANRINKYIKNHFEFFIASSEYAIRKPDKLIFELALRKANLNNEDVWYCGDNEYCDIKGANESLIYPVWYVGGLNEEKAKNTLSCEHLKVYDWQELIDLLEE